MKIYTVKRLTMLGLLSLLFFGAGLTGLALAQAPNTLTRDLEPVVVSGGQALGLIGTPLNELFVYIDNGGSVVQIPFQIDEKIVSGYVATEDNLFDGNDEIVFMADDLGNQINPVTPISVTLPISPTWYEIEVTDPTTGNQGWAYVVRSNSLSYSLSTDYVDYLTGTNIISGTSYSTRLATTYPGLNNLTLNGGPDILDRTKLRATVNVIGTQTLTEEDLNDVVITLIKDGPVRVIVRQNANEAFPIYDASLNSIYLAYGSLLQATNDTQFTISSNSIDSIRTSIDLNSTASGNTTFYNAHLAGGVPVDGSPDSVPSTLSTWGQFSHTSGRAIQITNPSPIGGTAANFYRDNSTPEASNETGEAGSYGESGFLFSGDVANQATIENWLFVLPPGGNIGSTYQTYFEQRLEIAAEASPSVNLPKIFLPLVLK